MYSEMKFQCIFSNDDLFHYNAYIANQIEAERRIYASVNLPSLLQIMACRLVGAKPLSETMLEYRQ